MNLRNYRTSIIIAVTFTVLLSTFWYLQQLAFIVFLSLLLQLLLHPLVDRLSQKMPRGLAAGLVILAFILLSVLVFVLVSRSVIPNLTKFTRDFPVLMEGLQQNIAMHDVSSYLNDEADGLLDEVKSAALTALKSSVSMLFSLFGSIIDLVIIFFVTFYLLKDGNSIKNYLAGLFPHRDYGRVLALFDRILSALRTYICSQLIICCLTATVVLLYFTLRGLPYGPVFAMVSGIAEFVPVLGPTVASCFGTLLTATNGLGLAAQTAGFYLILTQINHNVVYPTLIGKSLNLHPISIILGIVLGGELLGPAGMFLAVPFIVICKLVIEDIYANRLKQNECLALSRWLVHERRDS